jgi:hypothetical protein
MKVIDSLIKVVHSLDALTENQDSTSIYGSNAKCRLEVAMSNNEAANQQEQKYYSKASGCSVKAQEDNLFDYKSWLKNKLHAKKTIAYLNSDPQISHI